MYYYFVKKKNLRRSYKATGKQQKLQESSDNEKAKKKLKLCITKSVISKKWISTLMFLFDFKTQRPNKDLLLQKY